MHMGDALLSPLVGGAMWAASAGTVAFCSKRRGYECGDRKVPLMGVLGAFVFAAQMINFSIPGAGSSGHLGGALLLAILLGPSAAFLAIASVLVVQALFFADGGLLALGCNIFNIGFFPAFIVFPFFYRKLIGKEPGPMRAAVVTVFSAVLGLQLGSFAVVLETFCSGISALPFSTFVLLMQPIHLAIGLVEGVATVAIVSFVRQARPDILREAVEVVPATPRSLWKVWLAFLVLAVMAAGVLSSFASKDPDGLEWAVTRSAGKVEPKPPENGVHRFSAALQGKTAWFPDYHLERPRGARPAYRQAPDGKRAERDYGSNISGVIGTFLTLLFSFLVGSLLKKGSRGAA